MSMHRASLGLMFLTLAAMVVLVCHGAESPIDESERLNEVTPLDALWEPAKGGLRHPDLEVQIAVPVRRIAKNSQCLPVVLWLKNAGEREIQLSMSKPNLPWHGLISVNNADGANIIEQRCWIAKHFPLTGILKPGMIRSFYINGLDQGCGYRPREDGLKAGKHTVQGPGSNRVIVEIYEQLIVETDEQ